MCGKERIVADASKGDVATIFANFEKKNREEKEPKIKNIDE